MNTTNKRLRTLLDIGLELASERHPDLLLTKLCTASHDLFGATYVTMGILDRSDRSVRRIESCGSDAASWLRAGDRPTGILATVVGERQTLRGDNADGDPTRLALPSLHPNIKAFLAAPIMSVSHVYGWICLVINDGRTFTEEDEEIAAALSAQVGRLYELAQAILEREQAESALRHERDRARAQRYLDAADVILLALDLDGRITLINRKGCDLLGWTEQELLGRDWSETCLPPDARRQLESNVQNLVGGDLNIIENTIVTRSGAERLIEWHNTAVRDSGGDVVGTLSSGTDITVRRQASEAQRASEGRYRSLFENAPDGIVIADREGRYIDANASMCRMLGYSRDELVGLNAADIVDPSEIEHIGPALHAIKALSDYHHEWRFLRKDRSVVTTDVISTVMPDGNLLAMIRDVTERNQAVEALQTAEERMRFALESANVGIWDMDYATGVLQWSPTLEAHYGLPAGGFTGTFEAFAERIHPEDRGAVLETLAKAMKTGRDFSLRHRTLWADGTIRWLNGAGRVFLDDRGEPVRGVGISQDVTERRQAEATLGQSETRKAAILDSVLDCIVTMDADGRVIEFNASAERTFGYAKADVMGCLLADLIIPPQMRPRHNAGLARYLTTGEGALLGKLIEITAMRSDGSEIPVELAITAIHTDTTPIFTGVLRDITARRKADQTRARLAAIVNSSDDAIFSMTLDGTILTWNTGAERLYGYTAAEAIGESRSFLVPLQRQAELTPIMEKLARGEPGDAFETQRTRKDGSTIDISLTISPMTDSTGVVTGASTIGRDITSRKRAEAELQRLNAEIQHQRLRVFKATITTVQDIVNNLLNGFQLVRLEGDLPAATLTLVDETIQQAAVKLKTLGDLETVTEKEMAIGLGIDFPGSGY